MSWPWTLRAAGHWDAAKGHDFLPHTHNVWEFTYYREGRILCPVGEEPHWSEPGMIVLTMPGETHWERAVTAYANYFLNVEAPDLEPQSQVVYDDEAGTLRYLFALTVREWTRSGYRGNDVCRRLMDLLKPLLLRAAGDRRASRAERLVRDAESLLEQRSAQPVRMADIAGELGVSPAALRATFAQVRGHSPMHHLQMLRLNRAIAMIRNSDATLAVVAETCGYDSASHLSRHVKRITRQTPGSFRAHTASAQSLRAAR